MQQAMQSNAVVNVDIRQQINEPGSEPEWQGESRRGGRIRQIRSEHQRWKLPSAHREAVGFRAAWRRTLIASRSPPSAETHCL